jgi:prepilin-type processing-associated H-X9-DG protein
MIGDAADEETMMPSPNPGGRNDVWEARIRHEQGRQAGTLATLSESLDNMDVWRPQDFQKPQSSFVNTQRAGRTTHLKAYANWVFADAHVEKVRWEKTSTCEDWLRRYGVKHPDKTCFN